MIISDRVKTCLHQKTIKYYKSLGYEGKLYDEIWVKVDELPKSSRVKIHVKCDRCGQENKINFRNYNTQISRQNFYCCHSCSFEKNKITNIEKYGTEFSFQAEEVKSKIKNSIKERFGCEYALQNRELFSKAISKASKRFKFGETELTYQGTFELDFINFCFENSIPIENGPTIPYKYLGKERRYFSDFIIPELNLIVEIKSDYLYKKEFYKNRAKKKASLSKGYKFLFVINKNYKELQKIMKPNEKEN
jgi:hypothetical protein